MHREDRGRAKFNLQMNRSWGCRWQEKALQSGAFAVSLTRQLGFGRAGDQFSAIIVPDVRSLKEVIGSHLQKVPSAPWMCFGVVPSCVSSDCRLDAQEEFTESSHIQEARAMACLKQSRSAATLCSQGEISTGRMGAVFGHRVCPVKASISPGLVRRSNKHITQHNPALRYADHGVMAPRHEAGLATTTSGPGTWLG